MSEKITRRRMIHTTALAGAGVWLAGNQSPANNISSKSANEKLNLAIIGCGGRARGNLDGVKSENIVALCDVDENRAKQTFEEYPKARIFRDWRNLLDQMHKEIDAVVVSTPDHTHAHSSLAAMSLGKHCYCEKPLSRTVHEARRMAEMAKQKNLATQMGTQVHAIGNYRRVVELVQAGAIGPVRDVHVWVHAKFCGGDRPKETPPAPESLDWDRWLGPAPYRPYNKAYCPFSWRGWWDFGCGALGDFGCHLQDLAFWALKLRHPLTVEAQGPPVHPESTPAWMTVLSTYPARGDMPPVNLTWYDSGQKPPFLADRKIPDWDYGVLFIGDKGMLLSDYTRRLLLPAEKFSGYKMPGKTIPDSIGHHTEWLMACKTGSPTTCNFDYSGALTEAVLLGAMAYRVGKKLHWDAANLKAANCPEADQYIQGHNREGWPLPG